MTKSEGYLLDVSESPARHLADRAERVFEAVWRFDFADPGFCALDLGTGVDSHTLRSLMLDLKDRLSAVCGRRAGVRFVYRSLGRFDQQETTKFHLDGAPDQSLLILGYEPSKVRSRISFADYTRCAHDLGLEPKRFLDEFNPMYRKGEEMLTRYVTTLPQPDEDRTRILVVNNGSLPFDESRRNSLGVLHRAEILNPDAAERHVVNSIMLATGGPEDVGDEQLREFVDTEAISKKFYG